MNLYGKKVVLRAMERKDMVMFLEMVNSPEIEHMVVGWSFPVSSYSQEKWFEKAVEDTDNYRFVIEDLQTKEALGMINLGEIDWKNRDATYGIKLKVSAPKQSGYGSDAEFTLMRFAFEELQLHRLTSDVLSYNMPSIRMTEKCGAKREGLKRSAVFKEGKYHDLIYYGVLYEDFLDAARKANWL